jgi:hypothetical protein
VRANLRHALPAARRHGTRGGSGRGLRDAKSSTSIRSWRGGALRAPPAPCRCQR